MGWLRVELDKDLIEEIKKKKGRMTWEQFFKMCLEALEGDCDPKYMLIEFVASILTGDKEAMSIIALGLMLALDKLHPEFKVEISQLRVLLKTLIENPKAFHQLWDSIIGSSKSQ